MIAGRVWSGRGGKGNLLEVGRDGGEGEDLEAEDVEAGELRQRAAEQARHPVSGEVLDQQIEAGRRVG